MINEIIRDYETFIFFDSALLGKKSGSKSYIFINPIKIIYATSFEQVNNLLEQVDKYSKKYWVCGYLAYEAAFAFESRFSLRARGVKNNPLLGWFGVFEKPYFAGSLPGKKVSQPGFIPHVSVSHTMGKKEFSGKIKEIKKFIEQGFTYQVNFSYDIKVKSDASPFDLYMALRAAQPTDYCAFIKHKIPGSGCENYTLSFSPELFFHLKGENITFKPMKGTSFPGDKNLSNDEKNKAENLMITDLIRNDLGKICRKGTVGVKKLFEVEHHPTVSQMTSSVIGKLKSGIKFSDIVKNVFPSGSVTGAPKIETMKIIQKLEKGPREVYCGMLGFSSPEKSVFNVPIRTLCKSSADIDWNYRVGSGVTWGSNAAEEYDECERKCLFLTRSRQPEFEIMESILWDGGLIFWDEHVGRLKTSAKYFKYRVKEKKLKKLKNQIENKLKCHEKAKIRILLDKHGDFKWEYSILEKSSADLITIAELGAEKNNVFLFHKTTYRPWYVKNSKDVNVFDTVFINGKGEVTEGARSNLFVIKNGKLYTPPIKCGLLPGVLRAHLIKEGLCEEKILYKKDLLSADKLYCGNSVRGLVEVELIEK